jgi:DMSO reductase anchor subunit
LVATLLGLATSVAHLGQPLKAWRSFLGLRRSWLSREIVAFALFVPLAMAAAIVARGQARTEWQEALLWLTALAGMIAVACSGMVYHATQREGWRGKYSTGRFFGTTGVLGLGAASWAATAAGTRSIPFAVGIVITSILILSGEMAVLRLCEDDAECTGEAPSAPLARSAFLMRFRLGLLLRFRLAAGWAGVVLPLLGLLTARPVLWLALTTLVVCFLGEIVGRVLFFRAIAPPRMPGGIAA